MTDAENTPNTDALEQLVEQYTAGVDNLEEGTPSTWLTARSSIESQYSELSAEQAERVESADATLTENAGEVAAKLAAAGTPLRDLRGTTARPPEEWWWYLDVISHVSDSIEGTAKPQASLLSRLLDIAILIVLGIAVLILAPNLPQLAQRFFPPQPTVGPTSFPSWTPAPTGTIDPASFDFASAQPYKSKDNVLEIKLPTGWVAGEEQQVGQYRFTFGDQFNPSASLQILIQEPATLYQNIGIEGNPETPQAALESIRKSNEERGSGFTFSEVQPAKLGNYSGFSLAVSIPGNEQGAAQEYELRAGNAEAGKSIFVSMQGQQSMWQQVGGVLRQMADTMVINLSAIPTSTPTFTPHPLELTATFYQGNLQTIQAEILALTPSPTPLASPTTVGTADASGEAATAAPSPEVAATQTTEPTAAATTAP